jgi:hypothetical protein
MKVYTYKCFFYLITPVVENTPPSVLFTAYVVKHAKRVNPAALYIS